MGNPTIPEPAPEDEDRTPERHARRRLVMVGIAGGATALVGGAFLLVQTPDARQESLPEPPSSSVASETTPTPGTPESSAPARPAASSPASTPAKNTAGEKPGEKSATEKKIDEARAKAEADGFPLRRPPKAKGGGKKVNEAAVKQWTEPIKNGVVRVTTARQDLTGGATLRLAGDHGRSVGGGISCTDKIRLSEDAPATARPTVLMCWRTSSARSVVTLMATPKGIPSADANVSIIKREWAKLH